MDYQKLRVPYELLIGVLVLVSISLAMLDLCGVIPLATPPFRTIDKTILGILTVDYLVRLLFARNKYIFFKSNFFDLLAILPFDVLFSFFRFGRLVRVGRLIIVLSKLTRMLRLIGFLGVFRKRCSRFLYTNGFIYMLYCCIALIFLSAAAMCFLEGGTFADNLWWSIVTCTTVGYGDISPTSTGGRIIATLLMFFGIGFIGMLTGTITMYFLNHLDTQGESKHYRTQQELMKATKRLSHAQVETLIAMAHMMQHEQVEITIAMPEMDRIDGGEDEC